MQVRVTGAAAATCSRARGPARPASRPSAMQQEDAAGSSSRDGWTRTGHPSGLGPRVVRSPQARSAATVPAGQDPGHDPLDASSLPAAFAAAYGELRAEAERLLAA